MAVSKDTQEFIAIVKEILQERERDLLNPSPSLETMERTEDWENYRSYFYEWESEIGRNIEFPKIIGAMCYDSELKKIGQRLCPVMLRSSAWVQEAYCIANKEGFLTAPLRRGIKAAFEEMELLGLSHAHPSPPMPSLKEIFSLTHPTPKIKTEWKRTKILEDTKHDFVEDEFFPRNEFFERASYGEFDKKRKPRG